MNLLPAIASNPNRNKVYNADAITFLKALDAECINTIICSPPYFGLRDYQTSGVYWPAMSYRPMGGLPLVNLPAWWGELGLEPTPEMYIGHLVAVFREAKRALRDDGTLWVNVGDSYASGEIGRHDSVQGREIDGKRVTSKAETRQQMKLETGVAPKNLLGIPWRLAFALQADGWILRMDNIWHKPNPMPESVTDRPTKAHEYVFLFAKSARYYYDAEAIREPNTPDMQRRAALGHTRGGRVDGRDKSRNDRVDLAEWREIEADGRNKRSVWTVTTKPFEGAHFAVFPPDLIEPCILAGAPKGGVVCDPFMGSGTTGIVAQKHGRDWYGCELNRGYAEMANHRVQGRFDEYQAKQRGEAYTPSLFAEVSA